jgi:dUTP pyrophosphatase
LQVKIKRIDPDLPLPRRESDGAAGFDLITRTRTIIEPGQIGLVPANVIVEILRGYALIVAARSSTPMRTGLVIPHGIGIIDSDFHGDDDEIMVQVWNPTDAPVTVDRGDRIAQGILMKIEPVDWVTTDGSFGKTRGGFGTTG